MEPNICQKTWPPRVMASSEGLVDGSGPYPGAVVAQDIHILPTHVLRCCLPASGPLLLPCAPEGEET